MKKLFSSALLIAAAAASLFQATSAAFEETVTVAGTSFTVGESSGEGGGSEDTNTALKFLADLEAGSESSNLTDSVSGPTFDNITEEWTDEMLIKIHNKGTLPLDLISKSTYVNDPDVLRDDIFVQVLEWDDANSNGVLDSGETGSSYGHDSILRWRNDTFPLGELLTGETRGFVLRFDGSGVTESNIGSSAVYDFVFTGVEQ